MFRRLDFLGIGALKSATTSVHEYLRTHPQLFLPEAKEQPFFTHDEAWGEGWSSFASVAFRAAPSGVRRGLVSPQYMGGPVEWRESTARDADGSAASVTARRVASLVPDIRIFVMLRDPVERAISAYWQAVVLDDEQRPIDEALEAQLDEDALAAARAWPADEHQYIVVGEYGRLLAEWLESFDRSQLFVGATSVLDSEPMDLLGPLQAFLGVDESHVPANLDVRYQTRGTGRRSRALQLPAMAKHAPGLRWVFERMPSGLRDRARSRLRTFGYRYEQRSTSDDDRLHGRPSQRVLGRLREHYAPDIAELERLVGPVPGVTGPWRRWRREPESEGQPLEHGAQRAKSAG